MRERLKQIIAEEDKRNPLTDEQIARKLNIRRDEVTVLRHELGIDDSRKRRMPVLQKEMEALLSRYPDISNRELTNQLKQKGFEVSRFTVLNMRKEWGALSTGVHPEKGRFRRKQQAAGAAATFSAIIGAKGSLKAAIQQVQAAVLYPPNGLHTLLFGATGVGKSRLAEAMYQYAIEQGVLKKNAPFVLFNCADYAKNPQLLMSQLFGYVKGAFTGADQEKEGLVDKANGGILFLDEIHRLPPEGQENLFYLIDKGVYRRLGEVDFQRRAALLILGATTESPESSLLLTLRRRIPMTVELPSLAEWSVKERLALIFHFFNEEVDRIGKKAAVEKEVMEALLSYDCPGNAGQLHSDIRVLMARAFLNSISGEEEIVQVRQLDLPPQVAASMAGSRADLPMLKKERYLFVPGQQSLPVETEEPDEGITKLYEWIRERYENLRAQGQNKDLINLIVSRELKSRLDESAGDGKERVEERLLQLSKLVGERVVQTVEQMLWIAEKHLVFDYHRLLYVLAIHLKGVLDRFRASALPAADDDEAVETDSLAFHVAREMSKVVHTMWGIELPDRELSFLAMYLSQSDRRVSAKPMIGVVVASYGQVAKSMVEVAHRLFEKRYAIAVELYWDDDIQQAVERIGQAIRQADQGSGVILLADMGTLFLKEAEWQDTFGVPTRVIAPVTTSLVVEVLRKCMYSELTLRQLADDLSPGIGVPQPALSEPETKKEKAIVSVCLTGDGAARRLSSLLQERLGPRAGQIHFLNGSSLSIRKKVMTWQQQYEILAVVGTVNPMLEGVPFVSMEEILDERGLGFLKRLLTVRDGAEWRVDSTKPVYLHDLVKPELLFESLAATSKQEVIEQLTHALLANGYVKEQFAAKVWEREALGHTHIAGYAAIPHAESTQTIRPAVAIATLPAPIEWEPGVMIRCVFMLAVNERCQPAIEELFERITALSVTDAQDPLSPADVLARILQHQY
ncbi:sigma 54-interacting transcriptional regulator [Brevibacillus humidisoli]|uniref:sigma 54-interacting transcriptional regulator n=1 Tax=Brevibacillus humidisoli TaxID=2895522 RepID=UPI001E3B91E6|nr:sigma 54-interacting transcriptional regulator [Brevibacillus humidisoli]UFJ42350.1 sigma 54-interacting transcriptional regulator [Brevibacillus humidisoli]